MADDTQEALPRLPLGDRIRRRYRRHVGKPLERRVVGPIRAARNAGRSFRPVFVSGAMGSGTTLLALSLGQHFDCACVIEEGAIQIDPGSFLHVPDPSCFPSIRAYQEHTTPRPDWSVEKGRDAMLYLYRSHARGRSDVVFDKGPNVHQIRAGFLRRCFPDASFLLLFRDPVVNIEGFRRKWPRFGADPLEENIRFYREIHERGLEFAEEMKGRFVLLAYEDLVERYDAALAALGRHLELDPASRELRLPNRANLEGQGIRNVQAGRIGLVRSGNERAYARLAPEAVERIREALEPLHRRLRERALEI